MSFINKTIKRGYKSPRPRAYNSLIDTFTIRLHADAKIISGLTIEEGTNGQRNLAVLPGDHRKGSLGSLVAEGGVSFMTRNGKKWFIRYSEFSFVFNGREVEQEPEKPVKPPKQPVSEVVDIPAPVQEAA